MNRKTTLINLWGGPGSGKSTRAADVFAQLKVAGESAELVREYVKDWCWRGYEIGPFDDVYITAKQVRAESGLYGKVDYIVTDSPIGLAAVFEQLYKPGTFTMRHMVDDLYHRQLAAGVQVLDLLVNRVAPYEPVGRYETEAQALEVDELCRDYLTSNSRRYDTVHTTDRIFRLARAYRRIEERKDEPCPVR
jgi:hypothetical protein